MLNLTFGIHSLHIPMTVKVKEQFELNLVEETLSTENSSPESPHSPAQMTPAVRQELTAIWRCYNHLMDEINNVTQSLGKDGKFQLFICLSLRYIRF